MMGRSMHGVGTKISSWEKEETMISKLDEAGRNIALVGIYLPYCRLFGAMIDDCRWYPLSQAVEIYPSDSLYDSLVKQAAYLMPFRLRQNIIDIYQRMQQDVLEVISDDVSDFVYVHFFLPHEPFLYDRESGKLSIFNFNRSYLDNLQLTDVLLGEIINMLREKNLWDVSTLIVSSDHHWRDPRQYDGVLSKKIPLVVKLPLQSEMHVSDAEMSVLNLRSLVEKIMLDNITDPVDLAKEFEHTDRKIPRPLPTAESLFK